MYAHCKGYIVQSSIRLINVVPNFLDGFNNLLAKNSFKQMLMLIKQMLISSSYRCPRVNQKLLKLKFNKNYMGEICWDISVILR